MRTKTRIERLEQKQRKPVTIRILWPIDGDIAEDSETEEIVNLADCPDVIRLHWPEAMSK